MWKTTLALGALVLLPFGTARGSDPDAPEWKVPGVTRVAVELPVVQHAEKDGPLPAGERFVATLSAEGTLHYGPASRYAAGNGNAGFGSLAPTDGRTTLETLAGFTQALKAAVRKPGMRTGNGMGKVRLLVRADASLPWIQALWLMDAAAAPDVGIYRMQFAVRKDQASPESTWRLPHDFPLGGGDAGACFARLDLDADAEGRPRVRVLEPFDATGASVRRVLAELPVHPKRGLDLAALTKTLHAYRVRDSARKPTPLVCTLVLTPAGARAFRFRDALPIVSALRGLDARIHFRGTPASLLPAVTDLPYAGRRAPYGGKPPRATRRTRRWEKAVDEALRWLAAHQSPNGSWEGEGFGNWCDGKQAGPQRPDGAGQPHHDVGITALALLAFLGAGYTDRGEHPYVDNVARGLDYLASTQDEEGCFGPREHQRWVYAHAAATWAMVEAYGMTRKAGRHPAAQRGLRMIAQCRNPYFAWRYGIKSGDNDTSVSGWMLMPIALARVVNEEAGTREEPAPFAIDEGAFHGVQAWLDKMTDPDYGRIGYIQRGGSVARSQELIDRYPGDKSEAMTALGITLRVFSGHDPSRSRTVVRGLDLLRKLPPTWRPTDGSIDMYYWYWGALAAFQAGGKTWRVWSQALDEAVASNQRKDTTWCMVRGSWDPIGPWGPEGGRVYATALLALTLETPTRYARRFGR